MLKEKFFNGVKCDILGLSIAMMTLKLLKKKSVPWS
jgi:hypothetical protein